MSRPSARMSPFSQAVVTAMRKLYPESLADKSFDNTGLLLEAPSRPGLKNCALLTIDLTTGVADEAIARKDSIIVTYHPIIFRALKSITLENTQQNSLLRLAQEGISVYSPHTAVDAAPGGLNDWLTDIVIGKTAENQAFQDTVSERSVITPIQSPPEDFEAAGYGRIVRLSSPQTLQVLINRIKNGLGVQNLSVAVPQTFHQVQAKDDIHISSVGVCVGSGSMLNGLDVDLLVTGELSHHETLAAIENGKCVVSAFHSNSERGFLEQRMKSVLAKQLRSDIAEMEMEGNWEDGVPTECAVDVSKVDRDPYETV
ncbi:nif3 [Hyphodiscus hymeniophilus]|uniref:Nif3 n=1 Tax=Hyphodiscus hymeniophilus TaxID=353542 RepID=A0A9P6VGN4_9HELO|nr:nif3 [Hyphodiscus hymeniophilus]